MNVRAETPTDDRRQALEEFSKGSTNNPMTPAPSIAPMAGAPERVFGAQAVAVYRDESRILSKLTALGQAKGDDWYYRFPVRKGGEGGGQDWIEGPSIKLANDVARIYGNCDVDVRCFDLGDSWIFYARFTDFETGYSLTRPFQQRKNQRAMKTDNARALDIAFQIGTSKAIRNVVVNALQTFSDHAFDAARTSLVEKIGRELDAWRARTLQGLSKMPCDVARAERVIGRAAKDWLAPDVAMVIAMMKAVADGMATTDETFPPLDGKPSEGGNGAAADNAEGTTAQSDQTASTQTGQTNSPQSAAGQPASDGAPKSEAGKADATETKTAADTKTETAKEPTDEKTWAAYADATIAQLGSAEDGAKWWKDGKGLRNKCNVTEDVREEKLANLDAKVGTVRGAVKKK